MADEKKSTSTSKTTSTTAAATPAAPGTALFVVVGLAIVLAFAAFVIAMTRDSDDSSSGDDGAAAIAPAVKKDRYQAVYLDNERVYFGKLRAVSGDWFVLEDAFFIRQTEAKEGEQAGSEVVRITEEIAQPQQDLVLHGDSIDMVQNLTADSSVAEAIDDVVK